MDIKVSTAQFEDIEEIDLYLQKNPFSSPYHRLQWSLAINSAYGHEYRYLLARDNEIIGVLPIVIFRNITGRRYLISLPFCDVGGVVADDEVIANELIDYALSMADQMNAAPLELRDREYSDSVDMTDRKVSMLRELPESSEELFSQFKSKLRSQIRKAEKNGLSFDDTNDEKSVDDFFDVYSRNMHMLGSPTHAVSLFHELRKYYGEDLLIGRVWSEDKVVGAGVLLFQGKNVSIPWASTLRDYNRLAPNMLLYWNLLRIACERGCTQFDFGRSTYGEGTFKFKQQWGAEPVMLDWKCVDNSGIVSCGGGSGRYRKWIESGWRKMPLPAANIIGSCLRRYISL
jgi:FemAB-related protein (PEP-CTERM system-associated)